MTSSVTRATAKHARALPEGRGRFDAILERVGDARFVLLGEATHGTREFYEARAEITLRLIEEKGFDAVAVEADWPDALRISRYVQGGGAAGGNGDALSALGGFERFPRWMWRNTSVLRFVERLKTLNAARPAEARVGFHGLDLYSLCASIQAVLAYLAEVDPAAARVARERYACFDHIADDPQRYGFKTRFGMTASCEDKVLAQLAELTRGAGRFLRQDGPNAADELFYAQQNARVAANAEAYYRSMFEQRNAAWNRRDSHMMETLQALASHIGQGHGRPARIVVWAHNSHLGDARATEMGDEGQLDLGQLVRERYGAESVLVGFTTHAGTVTAASAWDEAAELKEVRPSLPESFERAFHDVGLPAFSLIPAVVPELCDTRLLERAIGVIYLPRSERSSHYFHANIARQFDALLHFDETHALEPLDASELWQVPSQPHEMETWPSGI